MKNLIRVVACSFLILQWSCQKEDGMDPTAGDPASSGILMEINVHQTTIDQYELPDEELHAAFISNEVRLLIHKRGVPASKNRTTGSVDTIFSYHEIPLLRETRSKFLIYDDGSSETYLEDITPEGVNPLYSLTEVPRSGDMVISRTHIKEGRLKIYDKNNKLLVDEAYPDDNLKVFVDSVLQFLPTSDSGHKILSLVNRLPPGVSRVNLPDGNVQLEQQLGTIPASVQAMSGAEPLKAVALMNEFMNQTLKFELYSGSQLIHRKSFEYEESGWLKNYANGKEISANPRRIVSQTIQLSGEGVPVIYTTTTVYHRNQTLFNVKKRELN